MKKQVFNFRLFLDGLKQLRTIGVLFTLAFSLIAVCIPVLSYISSLDRANHTITSVNFLEMHPLIILSFCVVAPLLTLFLFSFLNKRESSDFYHALPATRTCLFLSMTVSVITWLFISMALPTILSVICHLIFPQLFAVNLLSVFATFFNCFTGSLLVIASISIAMSVTGTVFSNILLSLLLIFLPRLLITLIVSCVSNMFPLVNSLPFIPILDAGYNVPAGFVLTFFTDSSATTNVLTQWESGLYTFIVAMVYFVLALFLFKKRNSESAGQSAPNHKLQALYRFLVGFAISCIPSFLLFSTLTDVHYGTSAEDIAMLLIFYLVAVLAMFVFEYLCTRQFKGLLRRGLFTVLWMVIGNVVFIGSIFGLYTAVSSYSPHAEDIQSVKIVQLNTDNGGSTPEYFSVQTAKIELTDPSVRSLIAKRLRYSLDLLDISQEKFYTEVQDAEFITVAIKDGLFTHRRRIPLFDGDTEIISKAVESVPEFKTVFMDLPETLPTVSFGNYRKNIVLDRETTELLYKTLQQEITTAGFESWYGLVTGQEYIFQKDNMLAPSVLCQLYLTYPVGMEWQRISIPLRSDVLPKTCDMYLQLYNEATLFNDTLLTPVQILDQALALPLSSIKHLEIEGHQFTNTYSFNWWVNQLDDESEQELTSFLESLRPLADKSVDSTKSLYQITISMQYEDSEYGSYYVDYSAYYQAPESTIPEWLLEELNTQDIYYYD